MKYKSVSFGRWHGGISIENLAVILLFFFFFFFSEMKNNYILHFGEQKNSVIHCSTPKMPTRCEKIK